MAYRNYANSVGLIVDPNGLGDFTTIGAALTAASSGQTIFIRPGTYTENPTLKAGVNLVAFEADAFTPNVIILGKCTATFAGSCSLAGIQLKTNGDYALVISGASVTNVTLANCYIVANNNAINLTSSGGASLILYYCQGQIRTNGANFFNTSAPGITIYGGSYTTDGSTIGTSAITGGALNIYASCYFASPVTTSNGANFTAFNSAVTGLITIGDTSTDSELYNSLLFNGSNSCVSISVGSICVISQCTVQSSAANVITGAGTVKYGSLVFTGSSSNINTTTQTPIPFPIPQGGTGDSSFTAYSVLCGGTTTTGALQNVSGLGTAGQVLTSNGASSLPTWQSGASVVAITSVTNGASPYTVLSTDEFLACQTSGGVITIKLPNAPTTGRVITIKDSNGAAATSNISITTVGGAVTIDGQTTYTMSTNYQSISVIFDGSNYEVF